jgi:hypothetical protein
VEIKAICDISGNLLAKCELPTCQILPNIILSNLGLFVVFTNPYAVISPSLYTQIYILNQTDYCYGDYYYYDTGCFLYRLTEYDVFIA